MDDERTRIGSSGGSAGDSNRSDERVEGVEEKMTRIARNKRTSETLERDLAALPGMSQKQLRQRWHELYGPIRPTRLSRNILLRALAYRIQEQVLGGLDAVTRRRLARAADDLAADRRLAPRGPATKPGTRLLREWQGVVHEVIVLERGALYRGKTWPSLSAVAREITSARWSGPRFFGLREAASGRT